MDHKLEKAEEGFLCEKGNKTQLEHSASPLHHSCQTPSQRLMSAEEKDYSALYQGGLLLCFGKGMSFLG